MCGGGVEPWEEPKTKAVGGKREDSAGLLAVEMAHGEGCGRSCCGERVNRECHSEYFRECTDATKSPTSL